MKTVAAILPSCNLHKINNSPSYTRLNLWQLGLFAALSGYSRLDLEQL